MEVRGTALRSALIACDEEFGEGSARRVIDALGEGHKRVADCAILGASWYPVAVQAAMHEAIRVVLGRGSLDANRRVGKRAALDDFRGVYRVFLPLLTWDQLWTSVSRAWLRYNSAGVIEFSERSSRSAKTTVHSVDGYTEPMWNAIAGRMSGVIELAGGRAVHARVVRCTATRCELEFDWER